MKLKIISLTCLVSLCGVLWGDGVYGGRIERDSDGNIIVASDLGGVNPYREPLTGPAMPRFDNAAEAAAIIRSNNETYCNSLRPVGIDPISLSGPVIDPNNYRGSTFSTMAVPIWERMISLPAPLPRGVTAASLAASAWQPTPKAYDPKADHAYPVKYLDEKILAPVETALKFCDPILMADAVESVLADTQALIATGDRKVINSGFYLEQELVKRNIVNENGLMKGLPGVNLDGLDLLTPLRQEEGLLIRTSINDGLVAESMIRSVCAGATGASKRACDQFLSWNEEYRAAIIQADWLFHSGSREYQDAMTAIAAAQNQLREFRKAFSVGNADISAGLGGLVRNLRQVDLNSTTRSQTPEQVERAVLQTTQEARGVLALPTVTAQFEQSAVQYIRGQLDLSDRMAHESVSLAASHGSPSLIRHLGTLASDVGHSTLAFLNGFNHGMGHGLVKAADAMQAIWNNPTLITHLSVDIMNTVTAGPGAVIDAGYRGLELVSSAVFEFEMTMLYGSAEQRGEALGEFGSTVLLGMVGGEAALGSRAVIEGAVAKMAEAGATEAIGTALNRTLRASEALAPEMAAIDQKVAQIGDSAAHHGIKIVTGPAATKVDKVILETLEGRGNLTSKFKLTVDEALDAGKKWVREGYREIGEANSGVFRSADGRRQFRMENGSITGSHAPNVPHVHLQEVMENGRQFKSNNHIPFGDQVTYE